MIPIVVRTPSIASEIMTLQLQCERTKFIKILNLERQQINCKYQNHYL